MSRIRAKSAFGELYDRGVVPVGALIGLTDPASTEIVAGAGFDFVVIDCEHGPIDRLGALAHVRAAEAVGAIALVRVPENSQTTIQGYLESGAQGIIVPRVESQEEAEAAAGAMRYGPEGRRGASPAVHAAGYAPAGWREHRRSSDEELLLLPMIESRAGVERVDEIVGVDGVDGLYFGPGDLSQDLGLDEVDMTHPSLVEAWECVKSAARAAGKRVFGGPSPLHDADALIVAMDMFLLISASAQQVKQYRELTQNAAAAG